MGDVINFAKARARRDRDRKKQLAPANRIKHGLPKDVRAAEKSIQDNIAQDHDGQKLLPDTDERDGRDD